MPDIEISSDRIEVTCTPTYREFWRYRVWLYRMSIWRSRAYYIATRVILGLIVFAALAYLMYWQGFRFIFPVESFAGMDDASVGSALFLPLILIASYTVPAFTVWIGYWNGYRRFHKRLDQTPLACQFIANPAGYECRVQDVISSGSWSDVCLIDRTAGIIALDTLSRRATQIAANQGLFIPERIFSARSDARDVYLQLKKWRSASVRSTLPSISAADPIDEVVGRISFQPERSAMTILRAAASTEKGQWARNLGSVLIASLPAAIYACGVYFLFLRGFISPLFKYVVIGGIAGRIIAQGIRVMRGVPAWSRGYSLPRNTDMGRIELVLGKKQFAVKSINGSTSYPWKVVQFVKRCKTNVVIGFNFAAGIVIPQSTFSSESERDQFIAMVSALQHQGCVPASPSVQDAVWPPPPDRLGLKSAFGVSGTAEWSDSVRADVAGRPDAMPSDRLD